MNLQHYLHRPGLPMLALVGLVAIGLAGCRDQAAARLERDRAVLDRFIELKEAGDPKASDLLDPVPVVPAEPMSQEEYDRYVLASLLHSDLRINQVRPPSPAASTDANRPPRFTLATQGTFNSPRLQVLAGTEAKPQQRSLYNPDVVVEVVDGKICCVSAGVAN